MGDTESTTKNSLLLPGDGVKNVILKDLRNGPFIVELNSQLIWRMWFLSVHVTDRFNDDGGSPREYRSP